MADDLHGPQAQATRSRLSILLMLTLCILGNGRCQVAGQQGHKRPPFCENADDRQKEPTSFLWSVVRTRNGGSATVVSAEEEDEDKDDNPASYFFGTIHVPYTRVWDFIPDNTKRAFEHSDHVFFELDLTDPYTISALTNCQLLPQGRNLAQVLPDELFRRLKRHLDYVKLMMPSWLTADQRGRGLYADYLFNAIAGNWERKRPVWVMLMVNSLTETDVRSRGIPVLDLYLAQEAERLDKVTGAVERVEEQCVPLNGLNLSQVLFALNQTLHLQECIRAGDGRAPYTTDDLINHYNCGDLNAVIFNRDTTQVPTLVNATLPPFDLFTARKIDEYFREELIYRRNVRMGKRVIELLAANPGKSFFFAFGAGHFLGNNTVLDVVRDAGFSVEHVSVYNTIGPRKRKGRPKAPVVPELSPLRDFSVLSSNTVVEEDGLDGVVPSWAFEEPNGVLATNSQVGPTARNRNRNRNRKQGSSHSMRGHVASASIAQPQSQSSFTPKARNFNDLWVRLDSFTTTRPPSRKVPSAKGDKATETHAMQRNLRIRYGPSKGASLDPVCNWWLLILASITLILCVGERSC